MEIKDTDPLRYLAQSTYEFYLRFGVTPQPQSAERNFLEEVNELIEAVAMDHDKEHIGEEAADVIVTIIGLCAAVGIGIEDLVKRIYQVAEKNDAKNHETHVSLNGKIRRRTTLSNEQSPNSEGEVENSVSP